MMPVNRVRILLGALAGAVVWIGWGIAIHLLVLGTRYAEAQKAGWFLEKPRYGFFGGAWMIVIFFLSWIGAWLYAGVRETYGPGPWTALKVGILFGFASGFPLAFACAAWLPAPRVFPLWWMLELWVGALVSVFISGWLYRE